MQCILQARVVFAGYEGYNYTHIQIKGKGVIAHDIPRKEAMDIINKHNLQYIKPGEYVNYDYRLGNIYADTKFKSYVNSHKNVKKNLFSVLDQLDNI